MCFDFYFDENWRAFWVSYFNIKAVTRICGLSDFGTVHLNASYKALMRKIVFVAYALREAKPDIFRAEDATRW